MQVIEQVTKRKTLSLPKKKDVEINPVVISPLADEEAHKKYTPKVVSYEYIKKRGSEMALEHKCLEAVYRDVLVGKEMFGSKSCVENLKVLRERLVVLFDLLKVLEDNDTNSLHLVLGGNIASNCNKKSLFESLEYLARTNIGSSDVQEVLKVLTELFIKGRDNLNSDAFKQACLPKTRVSVSRLKAESTSRHLYSLIHHQKLKMLAHWEENRVLLDLSETPEGCYKGNK